MSWVAAAAVGSAAIGAIASSRASKSASKGQDKALKANQELLGPFTTAGAAGLEGVQNFVDQGSNFADTRAFKDIINTQRASGGQLSGNTLTGLTDYYANNFRQQRMNELSFLPRLGANAASGYGT